MVSAAQSDKLAKRDEVIAECEAIVAKFDEYTDATYQSTKYDLFVRQSTYKNSPLTVTKAKLPGFTIDHHKNFRDNIAENVAKMNSEVKYTELEVIDGGRVMHQRIKMPFPMSGRSIINILHWKENEDGSGVFLNTSQGNEDLNEKYKKEIGKDVIGTNWFNYTHLKPYDGGMEYTMATCFDPNGSIPTMLKNQAAGRLLRNGEKMIHLMLTGEVLK